VKKQLTPAILSVALSCTLSWAQPGATTSSRDAEPAKPAILYDVGHNIYPDGPAFREFYEWLGKQGFDTRPHAGTFTPESLAGVDILSLNNALADANSEEWQLPTPSAFTKDEIDAIVNWVAAGGALLATVEHMPFPGAFEDLLTRFGVVVSNGFAIRKAGLSDLGTDEQFPFGEFVYRRSHGDLADHPILSGTRKDERIDTVATDWGSAFKLPDGATSFLTLPDDAVSVETEIAWEFNEPYTVVEVGVFRWLSGYGQFRETRVVVENDGWQLIGDLAIPDPFGGGEDVAGVLMLNQAAGDRQAYRHLSRELNERGLASLRLDMRGHGESTNRGEFVPGQNRRDPLIWDSEVDVPAALEFLGAQRGVDPNRLAVAGASYSGEEAAEAGRLFGFAQAYVLLSPGSFSGASVASIDSSLVDWLFIAARGDPFLTEIAASIRESSETAELLLVPGAKHATDLLEARPDLAEIVAIWLATRLSEP
jgi:dienelactone hydrolase